MLLWGFQLQLEAWGNAQSQRQAALTGKGVVVVLMVLELYASSWFFVVVWLYF